MRVRIRATWAVASLALLLGAAVMAPASATSGSSIASMELGRETVTVTIDGDVLQRSVEAWVAEDGRFRVTVASLDGSAASETVTFDGIRQVAVVTDPAGKQSTVEGDSASHFAVRSEQPTDGDGEKTVLFSMAPNGFVAGHRIEYVSGTVSDLALVWSTVKHDERRFQNEDQQLPSFELWAVAPVGGPIPRASGSNTATFTGFNGQGCVSAYNFRNTSTGYFRGSSRALNSCYYVSVTLWKGAATGGAGLCSAEQWLGTGPTAANFSSKVWTTSPVGMSPTCSSHAGWTPGWTLNVPWKGLNTAV